MVFDCTFLFLFFNVHFQTFIVSSSKKGGEIGYPFGYLKASSNLQTVNLFVMPYNFPALFPVIGKIIFCEFVSVRCNCFFEKLLPRVKLTQQCFCLLKGTENSSCQLKAKCLLSAKFDSAAVISSSISKVGMKSSQDLSISCVVQICLYQKSLPSYF